MGNQCCQKTSFQNEPRSKAEQEALLSVSKTSSFRTSDDKEHMILPPESADSKDLTDPKSRAVYVEICKATAASAKSVQQVGVESDFKEPASKVQDTNLKSELKPVHVLNDLMSMEDKKTGLNAEKSTRCDVSEKTEQEIKVKQKTVQTYESNQVLDSASQECKRDHLADFSERENLYNLEDPEKQTKRAKLSQYESDHQHDLGQTQATLPRDESTAKTLGIGQLGCLTEGIRNYQKSEEPVSISPKAFPKEPGSSELRDNAFNNELAVVTNTEMHISCIQEGNDREEDLYRDEDEIEKDKSQKLLEESQFAVVAAERSTIEPNMDIMEYCTREWKGNTAKAELMRKAYEAVCENFKSIRRVRGDNYCALRATLFQALKNVEHLPCLQQDDLEQIPDKLIDASYVWIKQWHFVIEDSRSENPVNVLKEYLTTLKEKYMHLREMNSWKEREAACEELFRSDTEEYRMYEAVKIMMLAKAIELDCNKVQEKEVPLFCWLMFARDSSTAPYQFMRNHLNHVGHTGGLDQVEMFLLGYSLQLTIRVFRLYKFGTDEFVTYYPDDHKDDWPSVTLITEDDRHYNVLVENTEMTIL
ncbi:ubiquitin thioesterase otulin-like isoform X1 [Mobula hypostoma]|uniref:ubiquitin thioesterase otulin-like isoform X1 n=1 Tax=Mobula hypostoma TaxID=723540 RepID=UPI002FC3D2E7